MQKLDSSFLVRNIILNYFTVHPTSTHLLIATMKLAIFLVAAFLTVITSTKEAEEDQYWYGGQSTGSGSGNTIGSHNAQSG